MDYVSYHYSDERMFNSKFVDLFGEPRKPEQYFFTSTTRFPSYNGEKPSNFDELCKENEHYTDIAASVQKVTEEIILKVVNSIHEETGLDKLCVAGGVGLNSVANGRILRETPFKEVFIQPAADDSGGALGAALYAYHTFLNKLRSFVLESSYWGKEYSDSQIAHFLKENNISYEYFSDDDKLQGKIVDDLRNVKVVGLYQGRFERGPRALGNRSILVDPRSEEMKDLVNIKIKFREPFRPFAPVIPAEEAGTFFSRS